MALQPLLLTYRARNNKTGLTDVKAQILLNNLPKAVGANAITLSEVSATNEPGLYSVFITAAQLLSWGAVATAKNTLVAYMDSASASLPDHSTREFTFASLDDIDAKLGTPANSTVSADLAAVAAQQAQVLSMITALTNAAKTGGANIIQVEALIPASGSTAVRVPVTLTDSKGAPITPSSISVTMANASGQDRGSYITGATQTGGGQFTFVPSPTQAGLYYIPVALPSTAAEEQLLIQVTYVYQGITYTVFALIEAVLDINAAGLATGSALAAVSTLVSNVLAKLNDSAQGLAAIYTQAANAASSSANAYATSQSNATAISGVNTNVLNLGGSGYDPTKNSLVQLTAAVQQLYNYVQANIVTGGKAI